MRGSGRIVESQRRVNYIDRNPSFAQQQCKDPTSRPGADDDDLEGSISLKGS